MMPGKARGWHRRGMLKDSLTYWRRAYAGRPDPEIAAHLDASYDCAASNARLAVWYTWPKDAEWSAAGGAGRRGWRRASG